MRNCHATEVRPTTLTTDPTWMKKFNAATGNPDPKIQAKLNESMNISYQSGVGELIWAMTTCRPDIAFTSVKDPDPKIQAKLAKSMDISYQSGVGELIWAMTTCHPDIAFTSVKLSQANTCPHEHHYHGLKHALMYLFSTRDDGIYFWRTAPHLEFKEGPLSQLNSYKQELLLDNRPEYEATQLDAYTDSDWATCVKTCQSFGGSCIGLAGGTIAYKCKFQPTVVGYSTEAEFMTAYDTGNMIFLCAVYCGTLIYLRRRPQSCTKTMKHAPQWVMLKSQQHEHDILT